MEWFGAELVRKGYKGQHILMVDNHDSHLRARPIQAAMKNNIVIFTFPSHCTHLVQMLDVCFFKSLKGQYKRVCKAWIDQETDERKPWISKLIFVQLFKKAWDAACKPELFKNGWARMGLTSCPDTGMVVINRRAILDVCLGGSEKYSDALDPAMEQSVRVRGAVNAEGVLQFHDFKFDFSAKALNTMETEQPESYALYLATRKHLFAQPGFVMHQRAVRPCKIANPNALVCTTASNLIAAQEKDARKDASTTKRKLNCLANIGKELGKVVNVDGVDLLPTALRGERNVYCQFCKQTLTRACAKAKCKAMATGEFIEIKQKKRKRDKDEASSDDEADVDDDADNISITSSDTVYRTEPWTHDPKGTRIIGRTFKVILLTEEKGHEGIWAKVERYLLFEKKFHMLEFKFASPTGVWVYEFFSVEEVYVAIKDSSYSVIPTNALALLSRPIDMSL